MNFIKVNISANLVYIQYMLDLQHKQRVHQCFSAELDPHYDVGQFLCSH